MPCLPPGSHPPDPVVRRDAIDRCHRAGPTGRCEPATRRGISRHWPTPVRGVLPLLVGALAALPAVTLTTVARGAVNDNARLTVHLVPTQAASPCDPAAARPACEDVVVRGELYPATYYAYVLITDGNATAGVAGAQFGITYDGVAGQGVDIYNWQGCLGSQLTTGTWPDPGSGNTVSWNGTSQCQRTEPGGAGSGVIVATGYFYMAAYSPDQLRLTGHPADGNARVADCAGSTLVMEGPANPHTPPRLGYASFSSATTAPGYNACDPSGVDCTISGPPRVYNFTPGNVFTAAAAPPNATFAWSITGQGSIVGAANGRSVSVTAGPSGTFQLAVDVWVPDLGVKRCVNTVFVVPVTCAVAGPTAVDPGTNTVYLAATDLTAPQYLWSVQGNGTLVGSTTSQTVTLHADQPGHALVSLQLTGLEGSASCQRDITIRDYTCDIAGPATLALGAQANYTVTTDMPSPTIAWTVTNGTLIPPLNTSSVTVVADRPDYVTLSVLLTGQSSKTCSRTITVTPVDCVINGPTTLQPDSIGTYTALTSIAGATYDWWVSAGATLLDPDGSPTMRARSTVPFTIHVDIHGTSENATCSRAVTMFLPTSCTIFGPSRLNPLSTGGPWTVYPSRTPLSIVWSTTGPLATASDPGATSVMLSSGLPGPGTVTATITTAEDPAPIQCTHAVTVNPPLCGIAGPASLPAYTPATQFSATPLYPGASYLWHTEGGVTLGDSTGATVTVAAGGAGSLVLRLAVTLGGATSECVRGITLLPVADPHPHPNACLLLHLAPAGGAGCAPLSGLACEQARTNGGLGANYYAYVLAGHGAAAPGVSGLACGLNYDGQPGSGVDIFSWTLCASLDQPTAGWPASGGGTVIQWQTLSGCQRNEPRGPGTGVTAVAGYFYLAAYSTDTVTLTPHPATGVARVTDCSFVDEAIARADDPPTLDRLGSLRFTGPGDDVGHNPCGVPAAVPAITPPPPAWTLYPPRPNPAVAGTTISWWQPIAEVVDLALYDLQGRRVEVLAGGRFDAGGHEVSWAPGTGRGGRRVAQGLYVVRLRIGDRVRAEKLVVPR